MRVLLADDHAVLRESLARVLTELGFQVSGAADGRAALRLATQFRPELALLDVSMPGLNGIETARLMMRDHPDVRICLLSMHQEDAYVLGAIQAGVHGYVLKNADVSELTKALGAIAAGHMYFSPEIAGVLSRCVQGQDRAPDVLSGREREILQLIAEGNNLRAIARMLSISPKTVKNHRDSIYRKTSCRSTAELVKAALRRGLTAA